MPKPRPVARTKPSTDMVRRRTLAIITGMLVLLLAICATAGYLDVTGHEAMRAALRLDAVNASVNAVREEVLNAENSQRGYLVTDRELYLEPFAAAVRDLPGLVGQLREMVRDSPDRLRIVAQLSQAVDNKVDEMSRIIALGKEGNTDAALALVNSDVGLRQSAEIAARIDQLQTGLRAARLAVDRRQTEATNLLMVVIASAAAGGVAAAGLALLELSRHMRLLRQREAERDQLIGTLEAHVAARTRELAQANQRFAIATSSAGVTVFSQDRNLRYLWSSQAFCDVSPDDIIGLADADLMPPASAARLDHAKRQVIQTGEPAQIELRLEYPDRKSWFDIALVPSFGGDGAVTGLVGGAVDITARKRSEDHIRLLMRELAHRSKNLLAVVTAMARQTVNSATSTRDFVDRFAARLQSLSSSYDLLIGADWHGVTIGDLVHSQLAHLADGHAPRIIAAGPSVVVPPDAAQNLGMALHELSTNAMKYGALSVPTGRVHVHWDVTHEAGEDPACRIDWREVGGPPVAPPSQRGFGQIVIERTVARALNGTVAITYSPDGLQWELRFPLPTQEAGRPLDAVP